MTTSDPIPSDFFGAGYSVGTNTITFNTAAHATPLLTELTSAEANATTGDYRSIVYALMEMLNTKFGAATPTPGKLSITRSSYEDGTANELIRTYTVQVRTVITGVEVADEV